MHKLIKRHDKILKLGTTDLTYHGSHWKIKVVKIENVANLRLVCYWLVMLFLISEGSKFMKLYCLLLTGSQENVDRFNSHPPFGLSYTLTLPKTEPVWILFITPLMVLNPNGKVLVQKTNCRNLKRHIIWDMALSVLLVEVKKIQF